MLNDIVVIWRAWLVSGRRARRWIIGVGVCAIGMYCSDLPEPQALQAFVKFIPMRLHILLLENVHRIVLVVEVPLFLVAMQLPDAPSVATSKKVRVSLMDLLTPMSYFITLLTNIWATAIVARKAW